MSQAKDGLWIAAALAFVRVFANSSDVSTLRTALPGLREVSSSCVLKAAES